MDYWIGKQYLYIPDIINSAMSSPIDWLMEQPLMAYIADTPGVKFLDDLLALGRQNGMIIPDIAVATIQSAWGINKASNTRIGDMNWLANDSLNNSSVNMNSQKVYNNAVKCWNKYHQFEVTVNGVGEINPSIYLNEFTQRNNNLVSQVISEMTNLLTTGYSKSVYNKLWRANKALELMESGSGLKAPGGSLKLPSGEITAIPNPSARDICEMINQITGWLLSNTLIGFIGKFASAYLPALSAVTTSVILKTLGVSGANGYRYLAGGMLKDSLTAIIAPTGTNYAIFAWIMAHAPVIILCALLIVTLIRRKQAVMGRYMYLIGLGADNQVKGMQFATVEPDPGETYNDSENSFRLWFPGQARLFRNQSAQSYTRLLCFSVGYKKECKLALDLTNPDIPVDIDKSEMDRFQSLILSDRPWWMGIDDEIHTQLGPSPHLIGKPPAVPQPRPDNLPTWDGILEPDEPWQYWWEENPGNPFEYS